MTGLGISFRSNAPIGVVGKLFASVFFLVFLAMGALFVWLTAREAAGALRTWAWHKIPCEILSSHVRDTDQQGRRTGKFYFDVTYRYTFNGQTFTSDQYKRSTQSFSDYAKVARLTERYRAESGTFCYVNSSSPAEAVLERDNLSIVPPVLFPMIFVAIGAGGIYLTWRRKPAAAASARAISDQAGPAKGRWVLYVFFLFFLIIGSATFYAFFLRPAFKILGARKWPAVPCVVLSSEVESHSDSDGVTYSVNILYSYEFKGREFKANRYHFMGEFSSGNSGKKAVVARHAPGTKTLCYVNPNEPTEAVLERGFTPDLWFGLIPLAFIAVGASGLAFALRKRSPSALAGGAVAGRVSAASGSALGAVPALQHAGAFNSGLLKPKASPWAKLFGIIAIALFWNGIISVFVKEAVDSWRSGRPEWFLTLFLVPFVLIGLGLLGGIFYCFLALFNPRPRLEVTPGAVPLGGALSVEWQVTGRTEVLRRLRVRLQGREEAKYRRGTSTCTDTSLFADLELADITTHQEMRSGYRTVTVPVHLMHSFASDNNRIVWSISLHGEIPRWPDVREEFPVTVLPVGGVGQKHL